MMYQRHCLLVPDVVVVLDVARAVVKVVDVVDHGLVLFSTYTLHNAQGSKYSSVLDGSAGRAVGSCLVCRPGLEHRLSAP